MKKKIVFLALVAFLCVPALGCGRKGPPRLPAPPVENALQKLTLFR